MGLTVLVSLIGFASREVRRDFAECPYDIIRYGHWYQLFSSGFLHVDLGHLFMNMFTLYYFGRPIERALGSWRFLVLYFGSMLAGSLLTLLFRHRDPTYRALGASGAISGVVFSFVLFAPMASIYVFLIPVGIPAFLFAIGYVALSAFGLRRRFGNIGHEAHLGGGLGGLLLTILLRPGVLGRFLSSF
jgi:membrane associated rhomboid family serine protease